ncbi:A disintegrin and metallopeptidase domain 3, partial [Galemys pyrenaicus]
VSSRAAAVQQPTDITMAWPAAHVLLSFLLIISGLGWLTCANHNSETSFLEITIPRKIRTNRIDGNEPEMHVTYAIKIGRRIYTFHLEKQGLLQFEDISYGIEPLESAATYEHMLYQINNNKVDFPPLRGNYPSAQLVDQSHRILVKSEYDYMGSEVAVATEKVVYIFGLINTMFSQLKVTIMLSSLEIWSGKNKISSDGHADELLQRFVSWKEKFLFQRSSNMAYLLIKILFSYRDHPSYVGATYHGKACDPKFSAGIALYPKMISSEAFSVVMAQLLGINMGLTYDDIYNCECPGPICIMNPEAIRSRGVKFFSSCSMDEFKHVVSQPEFECLQKQTISTVDFQRKSSVCGNGILEPPEQCDCGSVEHCTHEKCCRAEDCSLIKGAKCGSGPCCNKNTCLLFKRGHACRKSTDPCDFTEYCNGLSEFCVPDMKSLDLEPCNNGTAYCYHGICRDPDRQVSSHVCSQEVNIQNDEFGTCGKICDFANVFCGKIVCHWTYTRIVQTAQFDIQYTYLGGHICMSASMRNSSLIPDITFVENGTICGEGMYCKSGVCSSVQETKTNTGCDSKEKCQGHGLIIKHAAPKKNGLLITFYIFLPVLIIIVTITLKLYKMKRFWKREGT